MYAFFIQATVCVRLVWPDVSYFVGCTNFLEDSVETRIDYIDYIQKKKSVVPYV